MRKEQIEIVIDEMEEWFWALENGTANRRIPDIHGERFEPEEVDRVIKFIDKFTLYEVENHVEYWVRMGNQTKGKVINLPTHFNDLTGASREAFVQAIKAKKVEAQKIEAGINKTADLPEWYY